jgi:hypothetical protein
VVSGLSAFSILAFSEEHEKAWRPVLLAIAVPALLFAIGLAWDWARKKRRDT